MTARRSMETVRRMLACGLALVALVASPNGQQALARPRLFDGADVNEHILAAAVGLNETETLLSVEPLYGA